MGYLATRNRRAAKTKMDPKEAGRLTRHTRKVRRGAPAVLASAVTCVVTEHNALAPRAARHAGRPQASGAPVRRRVVERRGLGKGRIHWTCLVGLVPFGCGSRGWSNPVCSALWSAESRQRSSTQCALRTRCWASSTAGSRWRSRRVAVLLLFLLLLLQLQLCEHAQNQGGPPLHR